MVPRLARRRTRGCAGATSIRRRAFPYADLVAENARRGRGRPEYELLDTGAFDDDRYWDVDGRLRQGRARRPVPARPRPQRRARRRRRCTCSRRCGSATAGRGTPTSPRPPVIREDGGALVAERRDARHDDARRRRRARAAVLRQRDEHASASGASPGPPYPKDGINDHVVAGAADGQPRRTGTKAALWYRLEVAAGRDRRGAAAAARPRRASVGEVVGVDDARARRARPTPSTPRSLPPRPPDEALRHAPGVRRDAVEQAVLQLRRRPLAATAIPASRRPPAERLTGRNAGWRHVYNRDIISMPDKWEYPWYAAWDLAFHCVTLAHVDPEFAKEQLRLITREWYMHPNGQLPAYEWNFGDVNPPVHALAALAVFRLDGARDREWLGRDLPQAAARLHVVGERQGPARATTSSAAASWAWTTSGRSTARRRCPTDSCSSRPTAPAGWRSTA